MNYLEWNNSLAKHFFNEEMAGREVLLYVNESLINKIGAPFGAGLNEFIESVKEGPSWATRSGFCQKAIQTFEDWRLKGVDYPPYVSYLVFFVLAGGAEGDFDIRAYYPRLWQLLGEQEHLGTPPSFDRMIELWDDLEKWSREDKHEELGRFVARIRGSWWKVGLPLSQTLVCENERKHLPDLFKQAELDPTNTPSPDIVPKILGYYGKNIFEKRTLRLLESKKKDDAVLKNALIELILDELEEWDGTVKYKVIEHGQTRTQAQTGPSLRICLDIDELSQIVSSYLRFKTNKVFPEERLNFEQKGSAHVWSCTAAYQGWSSRLKDYQTDPPLTLDASKVDWNEGELLVDNENHWRAKLKGATTRSFLPGKHEGVPHWVEKRLDRGMEFLLACQGESIDKVKRWGVDSCEEFEEKKVTGLPSGWVLFSGKNALKSCPDIDTLSVSTSMRLHLRGGIKSGKGNRYFKFAPPKIVLENSTGIEKVMMKGIELKRPDAGEPVWELHDDVPVDEALHIEVELTDQPLRKILRLEDFELPFPFKKTPCRDHKGHLCTEETPVSHVSGVIVKTDRNEGPSYPKILPIHLSDRVVFIGERPGEIADWPCDPLPSDWCPVWAVANKGRKKWGAHFCGTPGHAKSDHCPGKPLDDRNKLKRWKETLWIRRKVTNPPELGQLRTIWDRYVKDARNV